MHDLSDIDVCLCVYIYIHTLVGCSHFCRMHFCGGTGRLGQVAQRSLGPTNGIRVWGLSTEVCTLQHAALLCMVAS